MKLYFRTLQKSDIPAILDISKDIWEGDDYVPFVLDEWLEDESSLNYGAFKEPIMNKLIGFGRVKVYNEKLAWLEGGRVKNAYQRKGIGREIMKYALDYVKGIGVKVVQYDTSSRNEGSIALADYFGFSRKKSMELLGCSFKKIKTNSLKSTKMKKISLNQARAFYRNINIGPGHEVCIGWSFVPLNYLTDQNSVWYRNDEAIIQKFEAHNRAFHKDLKNNEIWLIVYGKSEEGFKLVQNLILEEKRTNNTDYYVFCNPSMVSKVEDIGFSYWDDERVQVVLYEKKINDK